MTNFKFRYDKDESVRNMSDLKPMELRFIICDQIDNDKTIFWNYPEEFGSKEEWKRKMKQNTIFCDEIFIQLASNMLKRIIILIPVFGNGQVKIYHNVQQKDVNAFNHHALNVTKTKVSQLFNPKISQEPSRSTKRATSAYPNAYQHVK